MADVSMGQRLLLALVRLLTVAVGAVLALVALCGVMALLVVWGARRSWARLTGRPVAPWVLKSDPMAVWRRAAAFGRGVPPRAEPAPARRPAVADVTDVTPK